MTHRFIDAERRNHGIATMCRALRVSRSGFYAWRSRGVSERAASDVVLAARIAAIHAESDGTYGTPRVQAELHASGIRVSRRRVARLMAEQGLEGVSRRKRRRSTTTQSDRPCAPDLVERRFDAATGPDQVWFADITYVPTWEGWLYVALEQAGKLQVAKLNVDENPELAMRYSVMSIPTLLVFSGGEVVKRVVGAKGKGQLLQELNEFLPASH